MCSCEQILEAMIQLSNSTILGKDDNNFPFFSFSVRWQTGSPSTRQINAVLRLQPGVKDGTETPGDTDIDITYPVRVD